MDSNEVKDQNIVCVQIYVGWFVFCTKEKQTKISGEPPRMKRKVRQSNINVDVFFFVFLFIVLVECDFLKGWLTCPILTNCDMNEQKIYCENV